VGNPKVSVIIATLVRPTLRRTLASLYAQRGARIGEDFEVIPWRSGRNEYDARNLAAEEARGEILAFLDDDAVAPRDYIIKGIAHFENPRVMAMDTALEGDVWGKGVISIDVPYWGIGTTLWIRASAFREVGGFNACWGLDPCPRGWRSDTALIYDVIDKYGEEAYVHAGDITVQHPEMMKSTFQPEVELAFYMKYRGRVMQHIAPHDPRICQLIAAVGPREDREAAMNHLHSFVERGVMKEEEVREGISSMRKIVAELRRAGRIR
jgi:glycosyltransferase involved in cell wall biosynthesis